MPGIIESLLRDLRFGWKVLRQQPVLSGAAVFCLALGIGATTVIFSLIHGVLLNPLPYPDSDNIFILWQEFPGGVSQRSPVSGKELLDFQQQRQIFEHVAGLIPWIFDLDSSDPPQRLNASRLSASGFAVLGVKPALGRTYTEEEEQQGERLVVLSHALWQRVFASDPDILGQTASLSGVPHEVIGVMGSDFRPILEDSELWVPLVLRSQIPRDRRGVRVLTRLQDGVSQERARGDLDNLEQRFKQDYAELYPEGWGIHLDTLRESVAGGIRGRLSAFFVAAMLVLLIACANVANLLLAQAMARGKEVALRTALGAGRAALIRQLLTESMMLTGLGALGGLALAFLGLRLIVGLELGNVPRIEEVGINAQVLLFTLVLSVATGLLFSLVPALRLSNPDLHSTLKEGGKTSASGRRRPLRGFLVVAEIALAVVVLTGSGLTLRSFGKLLDIDPGFQVDNLVTTRLILPGPTYRAAERKKFFGDLDGSLSGLPGVEGVALASGLPFAVFGEVADILLEGQDPQRDDPGSAVGVSSVNPEYFKTMQIPVLQGRAFSAADHGETTPVVIVDSAMAERLWPDQSPIGQRLRMVGSFDESWRQVVGVVGHVKLRGLGDDMELLYTPFQQTPKPQVVVVLRTRLDPGTVVPAMREAVRNLDPKRPLFEVSTMEKLVASSLAGPRFIIVLFSLSGAAALLLAAAGVYGVMSYSVAQRTAEIGVRRALGAQRLDILKLVVARGMSLVAIGLGIGLSLIWLLTGLLSSQIEGLIFGVSATDPTTLAVVAATLLLSALIANLAPAARATRVDPIKALREES